MDSLRRSGKILESLGKFDGRKESEITWERMTMVMDAREGAEALLCGRFVAISVRVCMGYPLFSLFVMIIILSALYLGRKRKE